MLGKYQLAGDYVCAFSLQIVHMPLELLHKSDGQTASSMTLWATPTKKGRVIMTLPGLLFILQLKRLDKFSEKW